MSGAKVECRELGFIYDGDELPALRQVSFAVLPGEWTAIIGASGSGKSTLCQLLCGLLPRSGGGAREGELLLDGMDPAAAPLSSVASAVGALFQDPDAQLVQGIVEDEVAFGPENLRVPPAEIERRIIDSLTSVDLLDRRAEPVRSLSGGQRQRTAIAAVLALEPRLYVFDDACASLDQAMQARFLQLCAALQAEGRTIITASGRFDDAARAAQRVIVLDGGTVVQDGPPDELLRRCGEQMAQLGLLPRPAGEAAAPLAGGARPRSAAASPLLTLRSLSYRYPGGREALTDVDIVLAPGSWTLLTGENGSGKTTLSRLIMGLLPAPEGSILWRGEDMTRLPVRRRAERIGYVFQQPEYMFTAPNVWEELIYSLHGGLPAAKRPAMTEAERGRADELLKLSGLSGRLHMSPYLLSQSEKRLLSIISQMMVAKSLYLLDEPTSGMDYAAIDRLIGLCRYVIGEGAGMFMITHDPDILGPYADDVIRLQGGRKLESVHISELPL